MDLDIKFTAKGGTGNERTASIMENAFGFAIFVFVFGFYEGWGALHLVMALCIRLGLKWNWNMTLVALILDATALAACADTFLTIGIKRQELYTLLTSALLGGFFSGSLISILKSAYQATRSSE